jgi:hypothetical protein
MLQPFVLSLDDIEHVHFERVHFSSKSFDMVVIMKPGTVPKGSEEFQRISAIPMNKLDMIKMWLMDVLGRVGVTSWTLWRFVVTSTLWGCWRVVAGLHGGSATAELEADSEGCRAEARFLLGCGSGERGEERRGVGWPRNGGR